MKKSIFNINIYRPDTKKEKRARIPSEGDYTGLFALASLILLIVVAVYLVFGIYIPQKRMLEDAHSEAERLEQKLQGLKTSAQRLTSKKDFYLKLRGEAVCWYEKMLVISNAVPENIWFSRIEFPGRTGEIKGGESLQISGLTFSGFREENLDQIGTLLTSLNRSKEFQEEFGPLRLQYTKKSQSDWGITQFQYTGEARALTNFARAH